jgi:hypothetical protein
MSGVRAKVKMSQKSSIPAGKAGNAGPKPPAEQVVHNIRRATRKQHSSEEKIRIVLEGLRGEDSIAALCRREGGVSGFPCASGRLNAAVRPEPW